VIKEWKENVEESFFVCGESVLNKQVKGIKEKHNNDKLDF